MISQESTTKDVKLVGYRHLLLVVFLVNLQVEVSSEATESIWSPPLNPGDIHLKIGKFRPELSENLFSVITLHSGEK